MHLNQLKSSVHNKLNQKYIYDCSESIDFKEFNKESIIIANDTAIISVLALISYLQDLKITVLDNFDNRVKGFEDQLHKNGISYIEHISFWDHESLLLVNKKLISQVDQGENRYLLFICGSEMPHYSQRKNLDRQIFFNTTKLKNLKTLIEAFEDLSIKTWESYLCLLKPTTEIWFRQMVNAKTNKVVSDTTGACLDGYRFATMSILIAKKLKQLLSEEENIGVCLPTSVGGYLAILSLLMNAKTIVNLNYTASADALKYAITNAKINTIITSKAFIEKLKYKGFFIKEDFATLRLIVTGAEKLSKDVRNMFEAKFGKIINEGYGTTELSPVAAVNRPSKSPNKIGTVGLAVSGGQFKIIHPKSYEELPLGTEGMIIYRGVNKMDYYFNDLVKTKEVMINKYGHTWYMTGDKGKIDGEGYLTVVDRYSRFAKVAGEIISLGLLEQHIYEVLRERGYDSHNMDFEVLAIASTDSRRGEAINLLYTLEELEFDDFKDIVRLSNIENLYKPTNYFKITSVPKLGSGKVDFSKAKLLTNKLLKG